MQQGTPSLARKETWYHPDGSERVVEYDATGNVTPPLDVQYTQPPWSKNKPSGVEQSLEQAASPTKKDKPPVEFIDAIGIIDPKNNNPVRMTQDNYDALEKSFLRLKGKGGINTIQDYYDLDFASRIKLIPAELGANISEDAIQAIVDNSNDPEKMNLFEKVFGASLFGQAVSAILNVGKSFVEGLIKPIIVNLTGNSDEVKKIVADSSSSDKSEEQIRKEAEEKIETQRKIDKTPTAVGASEMTKEAEERTTDAGTVSADKNIAAGDYSFLNKGGLLTKPKRKPKKPRGKGLASK
jgi:hypothetical protein